MPGLDKSRFTNLRECDDELVCGICLAIFVEPLVTPCCQQTYCRDCIIEWLRSHSICPNDRRFLTANRLTKPQRLVNNLLSKLEIKCDFYDKGCERKLTLQQLETHVKTCAHNPVMICGKCGELNGDLYAHNCMNNVLEKNKRLEISNQELTKNYADSILWCENYEQLIRHEFNKNAELKHQLEEIRARNVGLMMENKRLKQQKRVNSKKQRSSNWMMNKLLTK